jgi:hypothetical protein
VNAFGVVIVVVFESVFHDEDKLDDGSMCIISAEEGWLNVTFFVHENKNEIREDQIEGSAEARSALGWLLAAPLVLRNFPVSTGTGVATIGSCPRTSLISAASWSASRV